VLNVLPDEEALDVGLDLHDMLLILRRVLSKVFLVGGHNFSIVRTAEVTGSAASFSHF